MVRGWVTYYGAFHPETLKRFLVRIIDLYWDAGQRINTKGLEEINGKFGLSLSAVEKVITVDLSSGWSVFMVWHQTIKAGEELLSNTANSYQKR
jgi:hypothetical protein